MRFRVWSLALLIGLRTRHCPELWCRLQTQLGSGVSVGVGSAGGYSSDGLPSLGTSIRRGYGPRKDQKKKKKVLKWTVLVPSSCYFHKIVQPKAESHEVLHGLSGAHLLKVGSGFTSAITSGGPNTNSRYKNHNLMRKF